VDHCPFPAQPKFFFQMLYPPLSPMQTRGGFSNGANSLRSPCIMAGFPNAVLLTMYFILPFYQGGYDFP
jgi:hypothetical protein